MRKHKCDSLIQLRKKKTNAYATRLKMIMFQNVFSAFYKLRSLIEGFTTFYLCVSLYQAIESCIYKQNFRFNRRFVCRAMLL